MNLWNVFRMEIFKNLHDRTNIFIIVVLMCVNIVGGITLSDFIMNSNWFMMPEPSVFQEVMIMVLLFSALISLAFMFIYPYQLARVDYKNKVMSLMIASGVSRVQYYFVKIGSTLIFSFVSFLLVVIIPLLIATRGTPLQYVRFLYREIDLGFGSFLISWLSMFFILMTSVIIMRGKWSTIFVYFGLSIAAGIVFMIFRAILGIEWWDTDAYNIFAIVQNIISIIVFAIIGILVLRKQDL